MAVSKSVWLCVMILFTANVCHSDTILLKQGGRVHGDVTVRRDDRNRVTQYIVKLSPQGFLKLDAKQVKRHVVPKQSEESYAELLTSMPDTADSHWEMSQFCKKNRLVEQKLFHIQRALALDTNHAQARRALGYSWKDGKWSRQADEMKSRGYVQHKGIWRLPEDVTIETQAKAIDERQKKIRAEMKLWRSWIGKRRHSEAIENFKTLRDPMATMGLTGLLKKEKSPQAREIYVDTLGQLSTKNAAMVLIQVALFDEDVELRNLAAGKLEARSDKLFLTQALIPYLSEKNENAIINAAAVILGRIQHPDSILPLIDALNTTHVKVYAPKGNINTQFSNGPNGGLNGLTMNQKPKKVERRLSNRDVLNALSTMTKQNFQYSETKWRDWYKQQTAPANINLRRDL